MKKRSLALLEKIVVELSGTVGMNVVTRELTMQDRKDRDAVIAQWAADLITATATAIVDRVEQISEEAS